MVYIYSLLQAHYMLCILIDATAKEKSLKIKEQFDHLKSKYDTHKSKNVEVLISAEKVHYKWCMHYNHYSLMYSCAGVWLVVE